MTDTHYDVLIIGAGQAGGPLSTAFAKAGRRTALVERAHVGGTCVNEGCTPTKTMVASARAAYATRRAADYGVHGVGDVSVDMAVVRERKRAIVDSFRGGSERSIRDGGVDLIEGTARFVAPKTVEIQLNAGGTRRISAELVFINAGARPSRPNIRGLDTINALDSTSIMELDTVPEHLLILGSGYIGLEFGQMFRRFGSDVTIIQHGTRLLPREDDDLCVMIADMLREDGINLVFEAEAQSVERRADGSIVLTVATPTGQQTIAGSHLLLATGRTPNTDTLNCSVAGVNLDKHGFIVVNERLETSAPGVYALGDIKGGPAFTHISYDDFRIVRDNLLHNSTRTVADRPVPYTVYIDPQFARVGLSEREAAAQGLDVRIAAMPMSRVARALEINETRGMIKALIARDDQILGFAMLGIEGGEIMSLVQVAMAGKLPYTALRDMVFAHPAIAECLNNLFASVE